MDGLKPSPEPTALPPALAARWIELPPDPETEQWIAEHGARPHGALASALHRTLRRVASDYDVDGWLGMHPMHLLGTASWRVLLAGWPEGGALLDVGAGRGDVTAALAPLFSRVVATETSRPMVRRLRARGYEAHELDIASAPLPGTELFSAVAMLNVLDRCARPRSLLDAALERLAPGGVLVVASPLPMRPHVDVGGHTVDPDEPLGVEGDGFEDSLASLVDVVLAPRGLEVVRWTRARYLARGDRTSGMHELDDVVLVAARR